MTNKTIEELTAEVEQLKKVIMPVAMWWNFVELQAEMAEDILENHATVLQCMLLCCNACILEEALVLP